MDLKRTLGLALAAVALALVVWGLWFAKVGVSFDVAMQPTSAKDLISAIAYAQNINVAADGSLMIGNAPTRVETLANDLAMDFAKAKAPRDKASQSVVIWATPETQRRHVDAVREAVAAGGWTKVSISMVASR
jgi:biopolymer transport protein ExbD